MDREGEILLMFVTQWSSEDFLILPDSFILIKFTGLTGTDDNFLKEPLSDNSFTWSADKCNARYPLDPNLARERCDEYSTINENTHCTFRRACYDNTKNFTFIGSTAPLPERSGYYQLALFFVDPRINIDTVSYAFAHIDSCN